MLIAVGALLLEGLFDDALHLHRHARSQAANRIGVFVENGVDDRLGVFTPKRSPANDHFVKSDSQRPQIGASIDLPAARLLR